MDAVAKVNNQRLIVFTPGNVRRRHISVRGLVDIFPPDCRGPTRKQFFAARISYNRRPTIS